MTGGRWKGPVTGPKDGRWQGPKRLPPSPRMPRKSPKPDTTWQDYLGEANLTALKRAVAAREARAREKGRQEGLRAAQGAAETPQGAAGRPEIPDADAFHRGGGEPIKGAFAPEPDPNDPAVKIQKFLDEHPDAVRRTRPRPRQEPAEPPDVPPPPREAKPVRLKIRRKES